MRAAAVLLALASASCTLSNPFGLECVSDQNCGCAGCCIAYRCTAVGTTSEPTDAGDTGDAGTGWTVSTFAGGERGTADGLGTAAQFSSPGALAIDAVGNLFVADVDNNCIRKVDTAGNVTTLAPADFPCGSDVLQGPRGVAVDKAGVVYIADTSNNCIRAIGSDGRARVVAGRCERQGGSCSDSPLPPAFRNPTAIAVTDPLLFISDGSNNSVRWLRRSDGAVGTLAGASSGTQPLHDGVCQFGNTCGAGSTASFNGPAGLSVAPNGALWLADPGNCAIRRITPEPGCSVLTVGPNICPTLISQQSLSQFIRPNAVAASSDGTLLFVADTGNHRVGALDMKGTLIHLAGDRTKGAEDGPAEQARFNYPAGIAVDARGRIFVSDSGNHRIRLLTRNTPP